MTLKDGKKLQPGQRVRLLQPGRTPLLGTVKDSDQYGVSIGWDNGLSGMALYRLGDAPFNCLSLDSTPIEELDRKIEELRAKIRDLEARRKNLKP